MVAIKLGRPCDRMSSLGGTASRASPTGRLVPCKPKGRGSYDYGLQSIYIYTYNIICMY